MALPVLVCGGLIASGGHAGLGVGVIMVWVFCLKPPVCRRLQVM